MVAAQCQVLVLLKAHKTRPFCSGMWSTPAGAFSNGGIPQRVQTRSQLKVQFMHFARAESQSDALAVAPGLVAERVFGFAGAIGGEGADLANARALGNSLLFCWLLPFFCCFLFYFGAAHTSPSAASCSTAVRPTSLLLLLPVLLRCGPAALARGQPAGLCWCAPAFAAGVPVTSQASGALCVGLSLSQLMGGRTCRAVLPAAGGDRERGRELGRHMQLSALQLNLKSCNTLQKHSYRIRVIACRRAVLHAAGGPGARARAGAPHGGCSCQPCSLI